MMMHAVQKLHLPATSAPCVVCSQDRAQEDTPISAKVTMVRTITSSMHVKKSAQTRTDRTLGLVLFIPVSSLV
jgi:hypothetical protein